MEEKYAYRFPPCPAHDMEGMESWLESMAKKGLFLDKDPFFAGFATFRKGQPKAVRYRLQPTPKKRGFLEGGDPDSAAIELAEEYGWTYLGIHWEFCIYTTDDPDARELDTDPQVQAIALHTLYKRRRNNFLWTVFELLFFIGLIVWLGPVSFLLGGQSWFTVLLFGVWVFYLILSVREFRQLKSLKERLAAGEPLSRSKDWKRRRWLHWISAALSVGLAIAFFGGWFYTRLFDWEDRLWQPRDTELPFATAEALGDFTEEEPWIIEETDHVAMRSAPLAREQILLSQRGSLGEQDIYLRVEYYDLRTQWLAEKLFAELLWQAQREKHYSGQQCPDLPTEQEALYHNFGSHLLLQDGTRVMLVSLTQYEEEHAIPAEEWTQVFAKSILP